MRNILTRLRDGAIRVYIVAMLVGSLPLLVFGGVFAWKLVTNPSHESVYDDPTGRFRMKLREDCFFGPCYKYADLRVRSGRAAGFTMQCTVNPRETPDLVFDRIADTKWSDWAFSWRLDGESASHTIDMRNDCRVEAVASDRPTSTTIRFYENCAFQPCRRSAEWTTGSGGYVYTTPCTLQADGDSEIFTKPDDVLGQVDVEFLAGQRAIQWTNASQAKSGQLLFDRDCDPTRTQKKLQPA